jgi:hypothetical protein
MDMVVVLPRRILVSTYTGFYHKVNPNEAAAGPLQQRKIVSQMKKRKVMF